MIHYYSLTTYFTPDHPNPSLTSAIAAKEPVPASAAGEDTDAVHRRFVKESAAAGIVKDGVSEPSRDNEIAYEVDFIEDLISTILFCILLYINVKIG